MAKRTIDVSANNVIAQQEIVFETATGADAPAIAPARVLQLNGTFVSSSNPLPVGGSVSLLFGGSAVSAGNPVAISLVTPIPAGTNAIGSVGLLLGGNPLSTTNALPITSTPPAAGASGQTSVATPGTFVALGASTSLTRGVIIKARFANTNLIRVRFTGNSTTTGFELGAGDSVFLEVNNLAQVQVDAVTANEGVSYIGS